MQAVNDATNSSTGVGALSSPPNPTGWSTKNRCPRTSTAYRSPLTHDVSILLSDMGTSPGQSPAAEDGSQTMGGGLCKPPLPPAGHRSALRDADVLGLRLD